MSVSIPADGGLLNVQPKLLSSIRRFGRYDTFKPVGPSSASVGSKSIGKVKIDCQLLFKRSRWGTLEGLPGGIMYLNLHFGLPQGCKVRDATVTVTLDEEDSCLKLYNPGLSRRVLHHSAAAVQVTEWFGPQNLGGERKPAFVTSKTTIVPEANIFGYGVGGLGHERSKMFRKEARWSFNGQLLRGKKSSAYTSLRWHLTENDIDGQSFHSPKFRTAFAFEHSGQPFLIKVTIEGKLEKWHHQVQSKLKFGMEGAKEGTVVTLVDFEDYRKFSHGLDAIAKGLPRAMEMENLEEIPMEIPDAIPGASFQQFSPGAPSHPISAAMPQNAAQRDTSNPQVLRPSEMHPTIEEAVQPHRTDGEATLDGRIQQTLPTAEDFKRVLLALSHRKLKDILPEDPLDDTSTSVNTSAGIEDAGQQSSGKQNHTSAETQVTATEETKSLDEIFGSRVDRDTMVKILSLPGIIALLQLLANLMGVFRSGSSSPIPKVNDGETHEKNSTGTKIPESSSSHERGSQAST